MAFNIDVPEPEYIETDDQARELLHRSMRKVEECPGELIGYDTETHGKKLPFKVGTRKPLDWMGDTVLLWSLSFFDDDQGRHRRWCLQLQHLQYFAGLLEHPDAWLTAWNAKYDGHVSWNSGINIWEANIVDGLALVNLYDENRRSSGLKKCADDYCGLAMTPYTELFDRDVHGKKAKEFETSLLDLPIDRVSNYASYDAYACLRTAEFLRDELKKVPISLEKTLWDHFLEVELDFTEILWRMERRGMLIDVDYLNSQIPKIDKVIAKLEKDINRVAGQVVSIKKTEGKQININAPAQLAKLFFGPKKEGGMGLVPIKMTKGGATLPQPSTDKDVMAALAETTELASMIVDCRKLQKTRSTYLTTLRDMAEHFEDGRIHPSFHQFGARCMPAGELVLTNRGYLPVEAVTPGDLVISHTGVPRRITNCLNNGIQKIVKVTLDNGLVLRTTLNHEYYTETDRWIEPRHLKVGDFVKVHSDVEIWCPIPKWKDFSVSSWGRVFNNKVGRFTRQWPKNKWGHLKVTLRRNGSQKRGKDRRDFAVHRLVALTFLGAPPKRKPEIRHLNGISWDNSLRNLTWGSSKENGADAQRHGTMLEKNNTRVTWDIVALIRQTPKVWGSDTRLARELGISREHVRDIRIGKRWLPRPEHIGGRAEFYTASVAKVEHEDLEMTYGLVVEKDHSHVTGGIVTHNTGRLSTSVPNSQNFPRPDTDEWGIRKAFIARPGYKLIVADYEQLEMRILADESEDKAMIGAIRDGKDLHSFTAARVIPGVTYEEVAAAKKADKPTPAQKHLVGIRQGCKPIGFGIMYGAGPPKISESIPISDEDVDAKLEEMPESKLNNKVKWLRKANPLLTEDQAIVKAARHSIAADKIGAYFGVFPRVKSFIDFTQELCRERKKVDLFGNPEVKPWGFVQTMFGRYRRLEDIDHSNRMYRGHAEREATNVVIQGTAADIVKAAMIRIEQSPRLNQLGLWLLNQIHDELVMEVPEENAETASVLVRKYMEHPLGKGVEALCVDIPVDLKIVDSWNLAK